MTLTAKQLQAAKPTQKRYRLYDKRGLYLEVLPAGGRYWRLKYRFGGKEKLLSFGVYPEVELSEARDRTDDARRLMRDGIDPGLIRKVAREKASSDRYTFEIAARSWIESQAHWKSTTHTQAMRRLERDVFPWIGSRSIIELSTRDIESVLERIQKRGNIETAHRVFQLVNQVFVFAVRKERVPQNPAATLRGTLMTVKTTHHPSVTDPKRVGELLRAIDDYHGSFAVQCALRLAPLVFVRPGELRQAVWAEFDLDGAEWRIPAERMKMGVPHIVPLANQVVAILDELHALTGPEGYVFPSMRTRSRSMSENTVNAALRRLGYAKDEATGHGFRSMASTLLNEQQWNRDAIERQLAHAERDKVRGAYNYAELLPERRRMMQAWADYLDVLRHNMSY
jgi:integrase